MASSTLRVRWWPVLVCTTKPSPSRPMSTRHSWKWIFKPVLRTTPAQKSSSFSLLTSSNFTAPTRASFTGAVMATLLRG